MRLDCAAGFRQYSDRLCLALRFQVLTLLIFCCLLQPFPRKSLRVQVIQVLRASGSCSMCDCPARPLEGIIRGRMLLSRYRFACSDATSPES
jgi:hypothetical protein